MSDFKITIRERDDNIHVMELKGYLDAHTTPILEDAFQNLLNDKKFRIVINCKDLSYISSAGLGVFMGFIEEIREKGGDIKLSNLSQKVYKVFDLLGFPALFDIFEKEEEAKAKFLDS